MAERVFCPPDLIRGGYGKSAFPGEGVPGLKKTVMLPSQLHADGRDTHPCIEPFLNFRQTFRCQLVTLLRLCGTKKSRRSLPDEVRMSEACFPDRSRLSPSEIRKVGRGSRETADSGGSFLRPPFFEHLEKEHDFPGGCGGADPPPGLPARRRVPARYCRLLWEADTRR